MENTQTARSTEPTFEIQDNGSARLMQVADVNGAEPSKVAATHFVMKTMFDTPFEVNDTFWAIFKSIVDVDDTQHFHDNTHPRVFFIFDTKAWS